MANEFSVSGAIAAQSQAHDAMARSMANGDTWQVYCRGAPYVTCASYRAAVLFVGKNRQKLYSIVKG